MTALSACLVCIYISREPGLSAQYPGFTTDGVLSKKMVKIPTPYDLAFFSSSRSMVFLNHIRDPQMDLKDELEMERRGGGGRRRSRSRDRGRRDDREGGGGGGGRDRGDRSGRY